MYIIDIIYVHLDGAYAVYIKTRSEILITLVCGNLLYSKTRYRFHFLTRLEFFLSVFYSVW